MNTESNELIARTKPPTVRANIRMALVGTGAVCQYTKKGFDTVTAPYRRRGGSERSLCQNSFTTLPSWSVLRTVAG